MIYEVIWTSRFKKSYKRCQKRRLPMQELKDVVEKLRNDVPLEGDVVVEEAIESMVPTYPSSKHGV
ncbi:MAG: hypothetical protein PUB71_05945 [Hallerella succinigenes]|uniref:type II toxin-antitoxin system YafQ family toxin n=1 Tax=Hallerella succinigenes TaxID=1896222 RepID=UPI0023F1887C|nr:type II toxin-antitoxin system YafQ family toxin [Hallerella succinigenes]MDD6092033.1 hypothetical protein [Hallerella succinigenes]